MFCLYIIVSNFLFFWVLCMFMCFLCFVLFSGLFVFLICLFSKEREKEWSGMGGEVVDLGGDGGRETVIRI